MYNKNFNFSILLIVSMIFMMNIIIFIKLFSLDFWWFSVFFSHVICVFLNEMVFKAWFDMKKFSKERIELNIKSKNLKVPKYIYKFELFFLIIVILLIGIFGYSFYKEVGISIANISSVFNQEQIIVKVDFPMYEQKSQKIVEMKKNKLNKISASYGGFLTVDILGSKNKIWNVEINYNQNSNSLKYFLMQKSFLQWKQSINNIMETCNLDKNKEQDISLKIYNNNDINNKYQIDINIIPIKTPQITLNIEQNTNKNKEIYNFLLALVANVKSEIPILSVELLVRTESNYNFNKIVAEFTGNAEIGNKELKFNLNTNGIPFTVKDKLYLKALLKTVNTDIYAYSNELMFPIKTKEEIKFELKQILEKLLVELKNKESNFILQKREINNLIQKGVVNVELLGIRSGIRNKVLLIEENITKILEYKDNFHLLSIIQVENLINELNKQNIEQSGITLVAKLQNLKQKFERESIVNEDDIKKNVNNLSLEAKNLHYKLDELINSQNLEIETIEKDDLNNILNNDKSEQKIMNINTFLKDKENLIKSTEQAIDEVIQKPMYIINIIRGIYAKKIKIAKENLKNADNNLEHSRLNNKKALNFIEKASINLNNISKINKEIDNVIAIARLETENAKKYLNNINHAEFESSLNVAQNKISEALFLLQNEENSQKEGRGDEDASAERTQQELISTQSKLDVNWRKKILEEIAKLKQQGEYSDSSIIKYLESELK